MVIAEIMSGIRTTDKLTLVIAPQESPRGRHGIQQLNLQEVRHLPVFQISCRNSILSDKRGNTFVSVTAFYSVKYYNIRSV